jgi:uncharacterized protein YdaU (DUF1376 family)
MFGTLIDVDNEGNLFLKDKAVALLPKLWEVFKERTLGSNMVRWIVLVDDYKSPYRKLPTEEREVLISKIIFSKERSKHFKNEKVLAAREEYRRAQYDPLIDQFNAMSDQMFQMNRIYREMKPTKENLDEMNDLQAKMAKAAKAREEVKQLIIKDQQEEVKIQGSGSENFSMFEAEQRLMGDD